MNLPEYTPKPYQLDNRFTYWKRSFICSFVCLLLILVSFAFPFIPKMGRFGLNQVSWMMIGLFLTAGKSNEQWAFYKLNWNAWHQQAINSGWNPIVLKLTLQEKFSTLTEINSKTTPFEKVYLFNHTSGRYYFNNYLNLSLASIFIGAIVSIPFGMLINKGFLLF